MTRQLVGGEHVFLFRNRDAALLFRGVERIHDQLAVDLHRLFLFAVVEVDSRPEAANAALAGLVQHRIGPHRQHAIGHLCLLLVVPGPRIADIPTAAAAQAAQQQTGADPPPGQGRVGPSSRFGFCEFCRSRSEVHSNASSLRDFPGNKLDSRLLQLGRDERPDCCAADGAGAEAAFVSRVAGIGLSLIGGG